ATEPVGRHPVTVEDVTDEDENGPWTPVVRRRRTRSTGSMPLPRDVPPRQHPRLSTAQQATVRKAEERLAQSERERIARRAATSLNAINCISSESTTSRGEGPSKPMPKGKTIDARNWGGINIPEHELDPEAQQRELGRYSPGRTSHNSIVDDYDSDEQHEMLDYWRTRK
ncbi:hypothetical protein C2E23DRAFT_687798, partial [Lenzites betulinus]